MDRRQSPGRGIVAALFLLLSALPVALPAAAQSRDSWLVAIDLWGNPVYQSLSLVRQGDSVSGALDGDPIAGSVEGDRIRFVATDRRHATYAFEGLMQGDALAGDADFPDSNHPERRIVHRFTARKLAERPPGAPRTYAFEPTDYANEFSPHRKPVLTIWPGDAVRTSTIDSGGVDREGITRALFGNPQTGPFFIATAEPGDTLAVKILRLRPNRNYADSLDTIVERALGGAFGAAAGELGKPVRWTLDLDRGMARPEHASGSLARFEVRMRPMLGGLAVAPGFGSAPISTGDSGRFGGNMDFNEVVEGNTVYLPVFQPGALLYLGDAHALQGDGETSQYALETSMDVEFAVDVIKGRSIPVPRVESPSQLMVLGQGGSLDDAVRQATSGLVRWLQQDYGLSLSECAQVLGSSVRYDVVTLAGRNAGLAARLDKAVLSTLEPKRP
jgi:acetamidase/formamidase